MPRKTQLLLCCSSFVGVFVFLAIILDLFFYKNSFFTNNTSFLNNLTQNSSFQKDDRTLKRAIGQMIIVGFRGTELDQDSGIIKAIQELNLGGVVLYDFDIPSFSSTRNIQSFRQVKQLISTLQKYAPTPLFIAIDAEGGKINRLKPKHGFVSILSAQELGRLNNLEITKKEAEKLAKQLAEIGINMNFAPVLDLNINPENPIIGKLGRSFSSDPQKVISHSKVFINTFKKYNIIPVAKHFPGHGSSFKDTHLGIVDVTNTYTKEELIPYKIFIKENLLDAIMTAHIMNKNIDPNYPVTLSKNFLSSLLREELGFRGVIISDDMQMKALTDSYDFEEVIIKAINAGCDILLFSNNSVLGYDEKLPYKIHRVIYEAVKTGKISFERIREASFRIKFLKEKYGLFSK